MRVRVLLLSSSGIPLAQCASSEVEKRMFAPSGKSKASRLQRMTLRRSFVQLCLRPVRGRDARRLTTGSASDGRRVDGWMNGLMDGRQLASACVLRPRCDENPLNVLSTKSESRVQSGFALSTPST